MKINIQSLEDDLTEFDSELDSSFIEHEIKQFYPEKIKVHVVLDKFRKDYRVDIDLATKAHYLCDRCLEAYEDQFETKERQIFHIGDTEIDHAEEIIQLPSSSTEIDLSPFLSEMILLYHPIKMVCKEDCKGICPNCGTDLNKQECQCNAEKTDPRWDDLKKFIK